MKYIRSKDGSISSTVLFNLLGELGFEDIKDFQSKNKLHVDGIFGLKSYAKLYSYCLNVENVDFEGYYYKHQYKKQQIIWHHSAGWDNARNMFNWWKQDGATHVATSIGIVDDGTVFKGFDESNWAASIGCSSKVFQNFGIKLKYRKSYTGRWYVTNNMDLDKGAVAVEITNWGNLTKKKNTYYSWANAKVNKSKVIKLDFKGYKYFEKYTDDEIKSLKYWTLLQAIRFNIPVDFNEKRFWTVNKDALSGKPGLYTHNSYRSDKVDVSPQPNLINMAKSLECYML